MPGILLDARWVRPDMTGVGRLAYNLLTALTRVSGKEIGLILNPGAWPGGRPPAGPMVFETGVALESHPATEAFEQWTIPRICREHGYGAFVSFEGRIPLHSPGVRSFSFINDLAYVKIRDGHSRKYRAFMALGARLSRFKAHRIFTISETMRGELLEAWGLEGRRVIVVPCAGSGLDRAPEIPVRNAVEPFFLSVGHTNSRKNLAGLLAAFAEFRTGRPEYSLVLTGNRETIACGLEGGRGKGVVNLGFVPDGSLRYLYRKACALVFLSFYEGFGIPLVDAAMSGCPTLCSDIPVVREVTGNGALFFDPSDPSDISAALHA